MKKRRVLLESELSEILFKNEKVLIGKNDEQWIFEIGRETTNDLSEGVSILMRFLEKTSPIWNIEYSPGEHLEIYPEKTLFWLTGGREEWTTLENYSLDWSKCYLDFQKEFGNLIVKIVKESKNLGEIRDSFIENLNLGVLYDFALSKNLIK